MAQYNCQYIFPQLFHDFRNDPFAPLFSLGFQGKTKAIEEKQVMASFGLLLPVFLLHLLFHASLGINLNQTCTEIVNVDPNVKFNFCMTTFQAVPDIKMVNLDCLGVIAVNLTKSNASSTIRYIQKILKQKQIPYVRSCLKDCLELYSDGIASLNVAVNDIKIENYNEANIYISATMDAPKTCENGFKERKGTRSPLTKRNKDMFQLSAIVLSVISMLSQNRV